MTSTANDVTGDARRTLPSRLTSFIGRERELADLERLAGTCRLLTLTGPGGCGKTRLALELASRLTSTFPDGIHVVSLAPLVDPIPVTSTIAATIGTREEPGEPLSETRARDRHQIGAAAPRQLRASAGGRSDDRRPARRLPQADGDRDQP